MILSTPRERAQFDLQRTLRASKNRPLAHACRRLRERFGYSRPEAFRIYGEHSLAIMTGEVSEVCAGYAKEGSKAYRFRGRGPGQTMYAITKPVKTGRDPETVELIVTYLNSVMALANYAEAQSCNDE